MSVSDKYDQFIFSGDPAHLKDTFQDRSWIVQKYKNRKLRSFLKQINHLEDMSDFDLMVYAYKLDLFVLKKAAASNQKLSHKDTIILSSARRILLMDGLKSFKEVFKDGPEAAGFWSRFTHVFSYQYFRWLNPFYMHKMVGPSLPLELAQKIAIDGLEAHRAEAEKHLPLLRTKKYFNHFSKVFNYSVLTALLTVVPYQGKQNYDQMKQEGIAAAVNTFTPIKVDSEKLLAQVKLNSRIEMNVLEYQRLYEKEHGMMPDADHLEALRAHYRQQYE